MEYKAFSAHGNRELNEDAYSCMENNGNYCFVVADGLGGHGNGELASQKAIEVFSREFGRVNENCKKYLHRAFTTSQKEITSMQQSKNEMKTTAVALSIIRGKCVWGHIGDSRLYHFRRGRFVVRTIDHSVAQLLSGIKPLEDMDIAMHPDRNKLMWVMGDKWTSPRYELSREMRLKKDDAFLLCTDGIWELMPTSTLCELLHQSKTASEWLDRIINEVEQNGRSKDMDNYTAIAVMAYR